MHDSIGIPACFTGERHGTDPVIPATSISSSVFRTEITGRHHLVTVTWCKDLLVHRLSIAFEGPGNSDEGSACKLDLKPWQFWKRQGSKNLTVEGSDVTIVWDLRMAIFDGETAPITDYYVAVVCKGEVVLLMGDMKKEAYRRTGCRPALTDPVFISRTEHLFGKSKFFARIKFHEKGKLHHVSVVERKSASSLGNERPADPEMEIAIDGEKVSHVKRLQWKFRGNEEITVGGRKLELYWDVHDWLFETGPRHGLFIFRPIMTVEELPDPTLVLPALSKEEKTSMAHDEMASGHTLQGFSFFMYAWKTQ
ncbi:hypothetical protein SAY86_031882 [Trapa natans]|uniref:DUF868 domain-containing protein n=1 Tax=Trapa natans TaxID=22666 RepID=A0AAN7LTI7_TRANT|nr:hypothetical protein SAY86_031882 [Trapa natans]